jgi:diguanylate cyclase (GGDEF)-like protein/PAS domain S-box-containing protein
VRSILNRLVLACLLPGVIGSSAVLYVSYQSERDQLQGDTIQTARALGQAVDAELMKAQAAAQALATSGHLVSKDFLAFYVQASNLLQQTQIGNNVVLSDATGQQLLNTIRPFSSPLSRHGNPAQLRRVFSTGKPVISDIYIGGVLRRPIMAIDVPVFKDDGAVAYDLSVGIFPERLVRIPLAQHLPSGWVVAIIDTQGVIASRNLAASSFVGKKATPLLLRRMAEVPEGIVETNSLEGIPISAVFSRSPATKWTVAIGIPTQQFTAQLRHRFLMLVAAVVTLLLAGVFTASLFAGRIARSIRALIAPATALGSGAPVTVPHIPLKEAAEVGSAIIVASNLLALHTLAANVYRNISEGVFATDPDGTIVSVNPAYCSMTGYAAEELIGANPRIIKSDRHDADFYRGIWDGISQQNFWRGEIWNRRKDGSLFLSSETITTMRDDSGRIAHYVGVISDITEAKQAAESIRHQAYHDPMTGLPNRSLFMERLQQAIARAHRNKKVMAVLFIDLDHFKEINDQFGHKIGDDLLKIAAARLSACVRESDTVARLGGDEFTAILNDIHGKNDAARVAHKMLEEMSRPFPIEKHELRISASIGVAIYPADGDCVATLVKAADKAMYEAKRGGRNAFACAPPVDRPVASV